MRFALALCLIGTAGAAMTREDCVRSLDATYDTKDEIVDLLEEAGHKMVSLNLKQPRISDQKTYFTTTAELSEIENHIAFAIHALETAMAEYQDQLLRHCAAIPTGSP